ncbi:hypothetical protein [Streptomyces sp. NPDC005760]|uniref:hypothetical protein n=1 Tax=Streptomyces sp. NPDC005760 TaxID=3156718 RepID=UPI0033D8935C
MGMTLGLLVSAAVLLHVGMEDAFNALAYGGRLMGVTLIAAALVELVAVLALVDYWGKRVMPYSGAAVLVGVGAVAGTNLMFLIIQIEGREHTPFLWLWIGLALWVVWALWELTRQNVWRGIPHPRGFALGAAVSAVVGAASLAYSQMYVPYNTPVKVPFGVSFGKPTLSADGSALQVPAHIEFRNSGSVRIYVVGTMWKVNGYPTKFSEDDGDMSAWKNDMWSYGSTLPHVIYSPSHMLGTGDITSPGSRLDPGDDFSLDATVEVPIKSGIGRVALSANASFIRADRCKLGNSYPESAEASWDTDSENGKHIWDAPGWVAAQGDEFYRFHSRIYRSSEMLNMTHRADYATAWWVLPKWREGDFFTRSGTDPYLTVAISRDPDGEEILSDSEQEPYGMKTMTQSTDRTFSQLMEAAKK